MHVSQALPAARRMAVRPTLPRGMERDGFVALVDAVAASLGVGAAAMMTFRTMIAATRPRAFKGGPEEPCCYLSQSEIARKRGVSPCRIRDHETVLQRAGLIQKRTMANGARSGFAGCGIFFGAGIARVNEFRGLRDRIEAERKAHGRLRGLRSSHRRHLNAVLLQLVDSLGQVPQVQAILSAFAQWPTGRELHRMSLEDLARHEAEAEQLAITASTLLHRARETISRPLENELPHIQDPTQDPRPAPCKDCVQEQHLVTSPPSDPLSVPPQEEAKLPDGRNKEDASSTGPRARRPFGREELYALCSEAMRLWLDIERQKRGRLDAHAFVIAAQRRLPELGIHPSVWDEAAGLLGEGAAMLCVLITDAKAADPAISLLSPGAYLRGMVRAQRSGALNIMGSLIGLSERHRRVS